MNSFLLCIASLFTACSAFSVTEFNCRSSPSMGKIRQPQCLDCNYFSRQQQRTELLASTISPNEDLMPGMAAIDEINDVIEQQMENIQDSPYFRLFCVDILASCEYMPQELFECYSETCEVYPVDDDEVRFS